MHVELGEAERGGERHVLHGEPPSRRQGDRPRPHVLAGMPAIGAAFQSRRHDDAIAFDAAVFLHEHGVGTRRHRRAGKDADRLPGFDCVVRGVAGGNPIDDGETLLAVGIEVVAAHRVAVDGGIIERRDIDRGDNVFSEYAAQNFAQRHGFAVLDRRDPLGNQALGLGDRKQRTVEGEAIVAELRHHAFPGDGAIWSGGSASACRTFAMDSISSSITTGTCASFSGASVAMATTQSSSG